MRPPPLPRNSGAASRSRLPGVPEPGRGLPGSLLPPWPDTHSPAFPPTTKLGATLRGEKGGQVLHVAFLGSNRDRWQPRRRRDDEHHVCSGQADLAASPGRQDTRAQPSSLQREPCDSGPPRSGSNDAADSWIKYRLKSLKTYCVRLANLIP